MMINLPLPLTSVRRESAANGWAFIIRYGLYVRSLTIMSFEVEDTLGVEAEAMRLIAARNTDAPSQVEIIPSSAIEYTDRDPKPIPRARSLSEVVDGAIVGLQLHMFQGTPE